MAQQGEAVQFLRVLLGKTADPLDFTEDDTAGFFVIAGGEVYLFVEVATAEQVGVMLMQTYRKVASARPSVARRAAARAAWDSMDPVAMLGSVAGMRGVPPRLLPRGLVWAPHGAQFAVITSSQAGTVDEAEALLGRVLALVAEKVDFEDHFPFDEIAHS